ncbi:MAG: Hint domain-containing protein [Pseudomonadota bacterium]
MAWIAISDGARPTWLKSCGDRLLPRGSLLLECLPDPDRITAQRVIHIDRDSEWRHRLSVTLTDRGVVEVEHQQGRSHFFAALKEPKRRADEPLRVTFSWDAPRRVATLSAEVPATGAIVTAQFDDPLPLPREDIDPMMRHGPQTLNLSLFALSDCLEPIGPMPSLAEDTKVATRAGTKLIQNLRPGDLVMTKPGFCAPVRHVVSREVPTLGEFSPVCLRAPYLGLDADLIVSPHHRLLLHGTDTEYLFGTESAMIEARHLAPMHGTTQIARPRVQRYWQVVLDEHASICTNGTWSESLFVGALNRSPVIRARSLLARSEPNLVPLHRTLAGPRLKPYEAIMLVSNLCA